MIVWTTQNLDLPDTLGNSRLKTLWKEKGSKKDPSKYRGLSIDSTVCKLIVNIILTRLPPWLEAQLANEQYGFRQNCGTTDGIYTVKRVHQISSRKKQPLFHSFLWTLLLHLITYQENGCLTPYQLGFVIEKSHKLLTSLKHCTKRPLSLSKTKRLILSRGTTKGPESFCLISM